MKSKNKVIMGVQEYKCDYEQDIIDSRWQGQHIQGARYTGYFDVTIHLRGFYNRKPYKTLMLVALIKAIKDFWRRK